MFKTICKKRLQLIVLTLIMSAFLTFTTSFAFGKASTSPVTISYSQVTPKYSIDYTSTLTTTMCSTSALIKAKTGGYLYLGKTMGVVVPKYAFSKDTVVSASFSYDLMDDTIEFVLGPSPASFNTPLQLFISWSDLDYFGLLNDPTLYYNRIPVVCSESEWGITYYLDHFSIYYFRRR